jgi:hypothetical protein
MVARAPRARLFLLGSLPVRERRGHLEVKVDGQRAKAEDDGESHDDV